MTPLRSIRLAMMIGVLLFGGVSWFLHRTPDWTPADSGVASQLTTMGRIIWPVAGLCLGLLFFRFRDAAAAAQASTLAILAWAVGESVALFGGAVFFLTAASGWYIAGVIALTITFVAFPPPVSR